MVRHLWLVRVKGSMRTLEKGENLSFHRRFIMDSVWIWPFRWVWSSGSKSNKKQARRPEALYIKLCFQHCKKKKCFSTLWALVDVKITEKTMMMLMMSQVGISLGPVQVYQNVILSFILLCFVHLSLLVLQSWVWSEMCCHLSTSHHHTADINTHESTQTYCVLHFFLKF